MKPLLTIPAIVLSLSWACAQTPISGIINSYHRVLEYLPVQNCVRVDNTSGLGITDKVMIVQMKGITVSVVNNNSFGSVSAYNDAGNYEINTICDIRGDSVFFIQQFLRTYNPQHKVQLVRIPQYGSAIVTDSLKAAAWDSAAGKGGVLAIAVTDQLILNAPVSADARGFRGGAYAQSSNTCSNFFPADNEFYNASSTSPQNGSWKGESACDLAMTYSGGKGAVANGAGGGNNHNNGGGGGSNLSTGGVGGGNSSTTGCTVSNPGKGGYALSSNSGARIFPGGGGGTGHSNNVAVTGGGGAGGGILFIQAATLISNGYSISAGGAKGGSAIGDGASGGGGGGTIIMDVISYSDAVNISAKGGDGGDEDDENYSGRCFGEGGGGSGGVIYFKNATPSGTVSVAGGVKGLKLNYLGCASLVQAAPGSAGSIVTSYAYKQSAVMSTCVSAALAGQLLFFQAKEENGQVLVNWIPAQPQPDKYVLQRKLQDGSWQTIYTTASVAGKPSYLYADAGLRAGRYYYRLRMEQAGGPPAFSSVVPVVIKEMPHYSVYPNPASAYIIVTGDLAPGEEICLYDYTGRKVYSQTVTAPQRMLKIHTTKLPRGLYVLRVQESNLRVRLH
ncbi:MAG TPA: T9SS type A sorting domain-containing protein [Flavisolibacter sp.]